LGVVVNSIIKKKENEFVIISSLTKRDLGDKTIMVQQRKQPKSAPTGWSKMGRLCAVGRMMRDEG
jgi:hypothetical protein